MGSGEFHTVEIVKLLYLKSARYVTAVVAAWYTIYRGDLSPVEGLGVTLLALYTLW